MSNAVSPLDVSLAAAACLFAWILFRGSLSVVRRSGASRMLWPGVDEEPSQPGEPTP